MLCMVHYLANFDLRCCFLRPVNCLQRQFREAQTSSTESKDIKCHASVSSVLIREPHVVFLGKNWHFVSKFWHVWYQKKP